MRMLLVGLHATDVDHTDGARLADLAAALLPERYPNVVGHATAMTAQPRLVEVAVVLHEGVVAPRAAVRWCVDDLLDRLDAEHELRRDGWACHAPRLPGDPASGW